MHDLYTHLKGHRLVSLLAPLFKMLEALFDLFVPLVVADIINVGIRNHDTGYILSRCGLLIVLALVGLGCSVVAQYFAARASVCCASSLRRALFAHIQSLGFSEVDTIGGSTLITRMTSDVNQVQNGLNMFLRLFLRSPFIVFGAAILALSLNRTVATVFLLSIPVLFLIVFGLMAITAPLYRKVQTRLDSVLGATRENLSGVRVVRAFAREDYETQRFAGFHDALTRLQLFVGRISALMNPLTYVVVNLAFIAILTLGAQQVQDGLLLDGDVVALVNYMSQVLIELVKLANTVILTSRALASLNRVSTVLHTPVSMAFPAETAPAETGEAVVFDHVSLHYHGAGDESLTDISFTARPGQTIGVIGGTGSGKTSLVHLIPRFYDATAGAVTILGRPASAVDERGDPREGGRGAPESPALLRHHPLQPPLGQRARLRPRPLGRPGGGAGRRVRPGQAPGARRGRGAGRPELLRRPAPAADHRPRPGAKARYSHPGRQRQRAGLRHRRGAAQVPAGASLAPYGVSRVPAHGVPAPGRPDSGAGRRASRGCGHPRSPAGHLPHLPGNL